MKYAFATILFLCFQISVAQDTLNLGLIKKKLDGVKDTHKKLEIVDTFISMDSIELTKTSAPFLLKDLELTLKEKLWDKALLRINVLSKYYIFKTLEQGEGFKLCEDFYPHLQACNDTKQKANFYINYAEAATYLQKFKQSLNILKDGISFLEKQKDSSLYEFGYAYLKAGENSTKINDFFKGVKYFQKASTIFLHQKDTLLYLWTQNGLSNLFSVSGLYKEAENTRKPIYILGKKIRTKQVITIAHLRASIDAFQQEKDSIELYHIEKALKNNLLHSKSEISKIVTILTLSFATGTFARQNQLERSDKLLKELRPELKNIKNNPYLNTYYTFGKSYNDFAHKKYKNAEQQLLVLLPKLKQANEASNLLHIQLLLAKIYEKQHNYNKSLAYYKTYLSTKDSLSNTTSRRKYAYVQTQFEVQKKDLEISKQQKNIQLLYAKNKLKNQWLLFGSFTLLALFFTLYLWKSRNFVKKKIQLQKVFAQDLIYNLENERKRISNELHDSVGQNLLLIKNKIFLDADKKPDTKLIDNTIDEVRNISQVLHPFQFEKLGLIGSIKNTAETFQKNSEIFYSFDLENIKTNIPTDKEIFIYRIIQECLNNVEKHSKAKACNVKMEISKDFVTFQVKDNGIGFDVTENSNLLNSLGMKTLKERAQIIGALLNINSVKGKGTTVQIKVKRNK